MEKNKLNRPIAVYLFAGAGGFSLGFEQAGFDVVAAVEIDPTHCATHKYNFPDTTVICADLLEITGEEIKQKAGIEDREISVVIGGSPCQGFSMQGKRDLDDPRNKLTKRFASLVKELNPQYFVFENVKGIAQGEQKKVLDEVISQLSIGYNLRVEILNSVQYGVPQNRERLFIIGSREGLNVALIQQAITRHPLKKGDLPSAPTVRDAIASLPNTNYFTKDTVINIDWAEMSDYGQILKGEKLDPLDFSYPRNHDLSVIYNIMNTDHSMKTKDRFFSLKQGEKDPISRFTRLDLNSVAPTLRAGTDATRGAHTAPRPIHPIYDRVITVREGARLHSYPDWFRLHASKYHGFRQVGNSVPPLLARAIASEVIKVLGVQPLKPSEIILLGDENLITFKPKDAIGYFANQLNQLSLF
jgi:DNA (cytosine-5)-methyltransferase 1